MTPPARMGDGTDVSFKGLSEVRKGDGTVLWSASDDIPDSVVDNFEDSPDGVYEDAENIEDYYKNGTDSYSRTTENVIEGDTALAVNGDGVAISEPGDGLNRYPDEGDTVAAVVRVGAGEFNPYILTNGSYDGEVDGYLWGIFGPDDIILIARLDGSDFTSLSSTTGVGLTNNTWYWIEAKLPSDFDNTLTLTLYEVDETRPPTRGAEVASTSTTDSDYTSNRGVGYRIGDETATSGVRWDWLRVIG